MLNICGLVFACILLVFFGNRVSSDFGLTTKWNPLSLVGLTVEKRKDPLVLLPAEKHIVVSTDGNNWNEEFFIYLVNNTAEPLYDVNIVSKFPVGVSVFLLPETQSGTIRTGSPSNEVSVGADFALGMVGVDGDPFTQTVINNIGPGDSRKIVVKVIKGNIKTDFNLVFKVENFSNTPKPILNK